MATKKAAKKAAPKTTTRSVRQAPASVGPRYRLLEDSVLDGGLVRAGKEITYYGLPGTALLAINDEAKDRKRQVRDIRTDPDLTAEQKQAAFKELSDEWNGVERVDELNFTDSEANLDDDDDAADGPIGGLRASRPPLPASERAELEKQALAGQAAENEKAKDDTNRVTVKLSGVTDPAPGELQGSTPALDAAGKTEAARAEAAKDASGKTDTAAKK
jgi:hypothetical protein